MVEMRSHLAIERARLVTLHLTAGAPELYPNQFKSGKLGGAKVTMSELWNAALAA